MEVLSNLTMNFIFVGLIVISLCIVCVFVLNYFYKNDYIEYYQWKSWKRKLFIMMFLFIVSIILLFFAHRCFEKSITDYNKNMEEQLEN
ncbi:TPA: hypothetical protein PAX33_001195 [Staphylococcus aureus]|nr:hypothetical protein [Staphylococcus aureus]HDD8094317.1 hypothetical protein [Staphylococcus aureus]